MESLLRRAFMNRGFWGSASSHWLVSLQCAPLLSSLSNPPTGRPSVSLLLLLLLLLLLHREGGGRCLLPTVGPLFSSSSCVETHRFLRILRASASRTRPPCVGEEEGDEEEEEEEEGAFVYACVCV